MDDTHVVHVLAGADELNQEELGFGLRVSFTPAEQVVERAVVTEFQDHIHIFIVLETVVKPHHMGMLQHLMQLDLGPELRFNPKHCDDEEKGEGMNGSQSD